MSLNRLLWSTQMWSAYWMWIASPSPLEAVTNEMFMFWMITLWTLAPDLPCMDSPMPVSPEFAPTPMIDLFDATGTSPAPENMPFTRMISGPLLAAALSSADSEVTVTVGPPAPPVVGPCPSPLSVAYPCMPVAGGGGVVGGGDVGGGEVGGGVPPLAALNVHCLVATLSQEFCTISAPEVVTLPEVFMHSELLTLTTRLLLPLAVSVHSWLVAPEQASCSMAFPALVAAPLTPAHSPLLADLIVKPLPAEVSVQRWPLAP